MSRARSFSRGRCRSGSRPKSRSQACDVALEELRWSHAVILDHFKDGRPVARLCEEVKRCNNNRNKINDLLRDCRLQVVQVMHADGPRYYSMDNRRLWALKQHVAPHIEIKVDLYTSPDDYDPSLFWRKMTTQTDGCSVRVASTGHGSAGGLWVFVDSPEEVQAVASRFRNTFDTNIFVDHITSFCRVWGTNLESVQEGCKHLQKNHRKDARRSDVTLQVDHPEVLTDIIHVSDQAESMVAWSELAEVTEEVGEDDADSDAEASSLADPEGWEEEDEHDEAELIDLGPGQILQRTFRVERPGKVIGSGGSVLRRLQRRHGVSIRIERPKYMRPGRPARCASRCTVTGSLPRILRAQNEITRLSLDRKELAFAQQASSRKTLIEKKLRVDIAVDEAQKVCAISSVDEQRIQEAVRIVANLAILDDFAFSWQTDPVAALAEGSQDVAMRIPTEWLWARASTLLFRTGCTISVIEEVIGPTTGQVFHLRLTGLPAAQRTIEARLDEQLELFRSGHCRRMQIDRDGMSEHALVKERLRAQPGLELAKVPTHVLKNDTTSAASKRTVFVFCDAVNIGDDAAAKNVEELCELLRTHFVDDVIAIDSCQKVVTELLAKKLDVGFQDVCAAICPEVACGQVRIETSTDGIVHLRGPQQMVEPAHRRLLAFLTEYREWAMPITNTNSYLLYITQTQEKFDAWRREFLETHVVRTMLEAEGCSSVGTTKMKKKDAIIEANRKKKNDATRMKNMKNDVAVHISLLSDEDTTVLVVEGRKDQVEVCAQQITKKSTKAARSRS
eukprot:TRINITY_DN120756_c0_g1_i1.p1 TRINITY_DN120756_c0_g1~~TRINITY_DN120756_c0_g1_i1.p1  ORF type:complete len:790 (-),score=118.62 TRINITY_DN120756_c0_g1_i1:61-2430(-)